MKDNRRGSKFEYKSRNPDALKKRLSERASGFDSIFKPGTDTFRPKVGKNYLRILPPTWEKAEHYGYDIWVHPWVGAKPASYLCPLKMRGEPCPICKTADESRDHNDSEEAKRLSPNRNVLYYVLDRDAKEPEQPLIYQVSKPFDDTLSNQCYDERTNETLEIDHPDVGYDVIVDREGKGLKTRYQAVIARKSSPTLDSTKDLDDLMEFLAANPIPKMLNFYPYQHLSNVILGQLADKDELDDDDDDAEHRSTKSRKRGGEEAEGEDREVESDRKARSDRKRSSDDDDDDADTPKSRKGKDRDDDDGEKEETRVERVRSAKSSKKDEEDEEEVDEDEENVEDEVEEEDEKPRRSRR